jgi:zinc ribbon protein
MILRTLFSIVNLGIFAGAIAFEFLVPSIGGYVVYGLLAYFVASLLIFRLPVMSRPIGKPRAPPAIRNTPTGKASPLPSSSAPQGPSSLGFCVYCGTMLVPGSVTCPSCGKPQPTF